MSYLFVSHSSQNDFQAIALQNWLIEQGWDELFLDLDPERGVVAGERWERALHEAASRCDAVLFCVSDSWLNSEWCLKEFRLAHRLNKRIVGLLIEDIAIETLPEELTSTWQLINLASGNDHEVFRTTHPNNGKEQHVHFSRAGLTRLKTGLVKAGLDPLFYEWPPKHDPGRSPYRGMLPLEFDDAGIFFGREAPINDLVARLRGLRDDPPPRFMVILGASGAGKSSFIRAGILPRLSRDERNFLSLPIIRPEHSVLWGERGLLSALSQIFDQYKLGSTRGALRKLIEADNDSSKYELITQLFKLSEQARLTHLEGETHSTMPALVLTIDQAEELFHSEGAEEARLFLSLLVKLAKQTELPLIILFTIRSDSYERLQTDKTLEGITQQTFSLTPMPQGAYHNVIEGPALRLKDSQRPLKIEPALVQVLLEDIEKGGNKDALPLLAFTLERLYLEYGGDGDLTLEEYHLMGGLEGAIEAAVERALKTAEKDPALPNERTAIEKLLRRGLIPWLAGIDPDTQAPRRRVARLSEIPAEARPIIDHLIEQRLLATDIDEANNETTIEPAHEALLRQWGLLQGWLEEDFAALTVLEGVQRASRDWAANNMESDWLSHSAGRLKDAEDINQRSDLMTFLNQTDWEYLKDCREMEDQQRDKELLEAKRLAETQKRVARRTTLGMLIAIVLTVVAGVLGWQAELSEREALEAGKKVEAQLVEANHNFGLALFEKAKQAEAEKDFEKVSFYSALAYSKLKSDRTDILSDVNRKWTQSTTNHITNAWSSFAENHHGDSVYGIAFSPDGTILASGETSGTIKLWDTSSGMLKNILFGTSDFLTDITFSPDGSTLAVGSGYGTIQLWDVRSAVRKAILISHTNMAFSVAFSPDGLTLASASGDKTIKLWDTTNGKLITTLKGHEDEVTSVVFSPDGLSLASGSKDKTIKLWDFASGILKKTLSDHTNEVWRVAFSPDGLTLASASGDKTINLWNTTKGKLKATLKGHNDKVMSVAFSPDGLTLASGSRDKTIKLWDMGSGVLKATLNGPDVVHRIVFSPDGLALASASGDQTIKLWDVSNGVLKTNLNGHTDDINNVTFSPDGLTMISASDDQTIKLWDTVSGTIKRTLSGHTKEVMGISISSDGLTLASSSSDKSIKLWDMASGMLKRTLSDDTDDIRSVAFSPDGLTLASVSSNQTIKLWDASNGKLIATLKGHKYKVTSVAFAPNGLSLASGSRDETIKLWDASNGKLIATLEGHKHGVTSVAFAPDGLTLASSSGDQTIKLWDTINGKLLTTLEGHMDEVTSVAFSPDGLTLASGSWDETIKLWDTTNGMLKTSLSGHTQAVTSVAFSSDGLTMVSGATDNTIKLWDTSSSVLKSTLNNQTKGYLEVIYSSDGLALISRSRDRTIKLWDTASGMIKRSLIGYISKDTRITMSPDGLTLASRSNERGIELWDTTNGTLKATLKDLKNKYGSVVFSPDGLSLASASGDQTIKLWDTTNGKLIATLEGHMDEVTSVAFSPDGLNLASGSRDETIKLWDTANGKLIAALKGHKGAVTSLVFSPDGLTLVSGSWEDRTVKTWNIVSNTLNTILNLSEKVFMLAFSPNSKILASGSQFGVTLWNFDTKKFQLLSTGYHRELAKIAFSPDSLTLVASFEDGKIILFDTSTGRLKATIDGHPDAVSSFDFSPDGLTLATGSADGVINLNLIQSNKLKHREFLDNWMNRMTTVKGYYLDRLNVKIKYPKVNLYGNKNTLKPRWSKNHPFHWLKKAEDGNAEAMLQLGIIYHRIPDNKKAKHWYSKALEASHPKAQQRLEVLKQTMEVAING